MTLKVVDPIDITEAVLTASDIPEPDLARGEVEFFSSSSEDGGPIGVAIDCRDDFLISVKRPAGFVISRDGGKTFSTATTPSSMILDVCVDKIDGRVYYIDSSSNVYSSSDQGFSYQLVYTANQSIHSISAHSGNVIIRTATPVVIVSSNHGSSFSSANLSAVVSGSVRDCYIDEINAYVCTETGEVATASGDFSSWVSRGVVFGDGLLCISGLDGKIFTGGRNGFLASSDDTFNSWSKIDSILPFRGDVSQIATSPSVGVVINPDVFNQGQSVLYSLDSGASWTRKKVAESEWPKFVCISSGYIATNTDRPDSSEQLTVINVNRFYRRGDEVIKSSTHRKYRCVTDATFEDPEVGVKLPIPTWLDIGPTNKWAMFDEKTTTSTIDGTSFSMTFNPVNYVNAMAFFNVAGTESINITVKDAGGTERYNEDFALLDISPIYDYYTYFFYQNTSNDELVADDLPPYYDPEITVTFTGNAISVGAMVMGFANQIGTALTDTQTDTLDYSRQEYDEFGELTYIERPVVKLNTYEVLADKTINPYIQNLIKKLRGKNTLWIGDIGGGQKLITYGRYERSPIPFTMPNDVRYSITVRGSI